MECNVWSPVLIVTAIPLESVAIAILFCERTRARSKSIGRLFSLPPGALRKTIPVWQLLTTEEKISNISLCSAVSFC